MRILLAPDLFAMMACIGADGHPAARRRPAAARPEAPRRVAGVRLLGHNARHGCDQEGAPTDAKPAIVSQYRAALAMLRQAVDACPEELWTAPVSAPQNEFWRAAYHAVFYCHLYLHRREVDFRPWRGHRDQSHFLGRLPWPPHEQPMATEPYTKAEVQSYLDDVAGEAESLVGVLDLDGDSGFEWLPFGKLELQIYNIRHVQQHAGELAERLAAEGVELDWVGRRP